jgi:hypothetical protein
MVFMGNKVQRAPFPYYFDEALVPISMLEKVAQAVRREIEEIAPPSRWSFQNTPVKVAYIIDIPFIIASVLKKEQS